MIVVVDSKNPFLSDALSSFAEVRQLSTSAITKDALRDVDAVVVRSETKVGPALLENTAVRFVGTATIGTDHVDTEYLERCSIGFASAPGSNANSVAEYLAAALLEAAARLGFALNGKTLGVVGVGNVGSRVVRVGKALGMHVIQNDPPRARATGSTGFVSLDDLMDADVITLHVPLTRDGQDATHHLFNRERLRTMKPGSILVNSARGPVVESRALHSVLASGSLRAAILDVWEGEPDVDPQLIDLVMLGTPHIAGYSFDGKVNAAHMMFDAITRHFGVDKCWPEPALMPAPRVERIVLQAEGGQQELIRQVVASCYSIIDDDRRFRTLGTMNNEERRTEFRRQRSSYPTRREFRATRVAGLAGRSAIGECLAALGFGVEQSQEASW
jgi:erythronate-4-phosphate dehydrogenase